MLKSELHWRSTIFKNWVTYKDLIKALVLHHGYILNVQPPKKVAFSAPDLIYYNTSSTVQVFKEPVANYILLSLPLTTLVSNVLIESRCHAMIYT